MDVLLHIQELLKERQWSIYRLAKESNLPQSTLSNMFMRNTAPTLVTLEAICKAFGITMSQFFADDGNVVEVTDVQRQVLAKWNALSEEQKAALLQIMGTMKSGR